MHKETDTFSKAFLCENPVENQLIVLKRVENGNWPHVRKILVQPGRNCEKYVKAIKQHEC